jgi:MFS family permease
MEFEQQQWPSSRDYLRELIRISFLSISIPLILFGWLYLEHSAGNLAPYVEDQLVAPVFLITMVLMSAIVYGGHVLLTKRLKDLDSASPLEHRLSVYKKVILIRFASYGLATLLVIAGFVVTASEMLLIPFAIMIILYSIYNPSLRGIVRELRLKDKEKETILKNEPFDAHG